MSGLKINIHEKHAGVACVELDGYLDAHTFEMFEDALEKLDQFNGEVRGVMARLEADFSQSVEQDMSEAEQVVYKMQFMNKLLLAADHLEEKLLDY